MRLNPSELSAIRTTFGAVDSLGHIDLFLDATQAIDLKTALTLQYRLTAACDTKVDLLVKTPDQADQPIHQIARRGMRL